VVGWPRYCPASRSTTPGARCPRQVDEGKAEDGALGEGARGREEDAEGDESGGDRPPQTAIVEGDGDPEGDRQQRVEPMARS